MELTKEELETILETFKLHEPVGQVKDGEFHCYRCGVDVEPDGCFTWRVARPSFYAAYQSSFPVEFEVIE